MDADVFVDFLIFLFLRSLFDGNRNENLYSESLNGDLLMYVMINRLVFGEGTKNNNKARIFLMNHVSPTLFFRFSIDFLRLTHPPNANFG